MILTSHATDRKAYSRRSGGCELVLQNPPVCSFKLCINCRKKGKMRPHTRFLLNIMMSDIWTVLFGALFFVLWICQGILAHNDWKTWWRVDCLNTIIIMYVIVKLPMICLHISSRHFLKTLTVGHRKSFSLYSPLACSDKSTQHTTSWEQACSKLVKSIKYLQIRKVASREQDY